MTLVYTRLILMLKMSERVGISGWDTLAPLSCNFIDGNPWPVSHARGCNAGIPWLALRYLTIDTVNLLTHEKRENT